VPDLRHNPKYEEESDVGLIMFLKTKCNGVAELKLATRMMISPTIL
jgi:hypothetical protein